MPSSLSNEKQSIEDQKIEDSAHDGLPPDPDQALYQRREAALVRKMDIFIAPVMMLLMLISYLDRGNVSPFASPVNRVSFSPFFLLLLT